MPKKYQSHIDKAQKRKLPKGCVCKKPFPHVFLRGDPEARNALIVREHRACPVGTEVMTRVKNGVVEE